MKTDCRTEAEKRSWIMSRIRSKNTKPEVQLRSLLHRAGLRFRCHVKLPGKPDVCLKRHNVVVFVHGCFWHGHSCRGGRLPKTNMEFWSSKLQRNRANDERSVSTLLAMGWRVAVVWECEPDCSPALIDFIRCSSETYLELPRSES